MLKRIIIYSLSMIDNEGYYKDANALHTYAELFVYDVPSGDLFAESTKRIISTTCLTCLAVHKASLRQQGRL